MKKPDIKLLQLMVFLKEGVPLRFVAELQDDIAGKVPVSQENAEPVIRACQHVIDSLRKDFPGA
jgi:hypothetical protein